MHAQQLAVGPGGWVARAPAPRPLTAAARVARWLGSNGRRPCACQAKRGRPRKTSDAETVAEPVAAPSASEDAPKRRGRPRSRAAEVESVGPLPEPPEQPQAQLQQQFAPRPPPQQPQEQPPQSQHDRVISYEMDITSSVELDYTDNAGLVVPSYTHQAQGHESGSRPLLDNFAAGSGFVGDEAYDAEQEAGAELPQPPPPLLQQPDEQGTGLAASVAGGDSLALQEPALELAEAAGADEDDPFAGIEEPPGIFDYEAGLPFADTYPEPESPLEFLAPEWKPANRRQADYQIRYLTWVSQLDRQAKQERYEDIARQYQCAQSKESYNHYLTAKGMAVVTAEIELEDYETGNRKDIFYPVWARAEHRWYPSGRFAAYNRYVSENLAELTIKYAPGADQEEDFDIMDEVLLMDPNAPDGDGSNAPGDGEGAEAAAGPAGGLGIDSFLAGVLPGTSQSELGAAYLDEVLAPAPADEELDLEELD